MTTTAGDLQIVPPPVPSMPALRAADQGVADALESVLSDNTRRVYGAQWRIFTDWCDSVGLQSLLPAEPLTVARYLAVRAGCRRQHRHPAPGHLRHRQGPRVGQAGIALPGPGRTRLSEGMGQTPCQTPAPVRRPHRRRAGCHPAHRRPAPQARPRH